MLEGILFPVIPIPMWLKHLKSNSSVLFPASLLLLVHMDKESISCLMGNNHVLFFDCEELKVYKINSMNQSKCRIGNSKGLSS